MPATSIKSSKKQLKPDPVLKQLKTKKPVITKSTNNVSVKKFDTSKLTSRPDFQKKLLEVAEGIDLDLDDLDPEMLDAWDEFDEEIRPKLIKKNWMLWAAIFSPIVLPGIVKGMRSEPTVPQPKVIIKGRQQEVIPPVEPRKIVNFTQKYFEDHGLELCRSLTETDLNRIKDNLKQNWDKGPDAFAEAFKESYPISKSRLETIYKNERHQAEYQGVLGRAQEADHSYKRWETVGDERTCDTCLAMDGEIVPIGDTFSNGQMIPSAHVNCRCSMTTYSEEDYEDLPDEFIRQDAAYLNDVASFMKQNKKCKVGTYDDTNACGPSKEAETENKLTLQEKQVVDYYQRTGYGKMNAYLRNNETNAVLPQERAIVEGQIKLLENTISKSKLSKELKVFKGVDDRIGLYSNIDNLVGTTVTDPGFCSTSMSVDIAAQHARSGKLALKGEVLPPKGIIAVMKLPSGTEALEIGQTEREVLVQHGTSFKVTAVDKSGPYWRVDMEAIPNSSTQLTPEEKSVIKSYSGNGYLGLNGALRRNELDEVTLKDVKLLDSAIAKSTLPERILFRGFSNKDVYNNDVTEVIDPGYLSTGKTDFTARVYAGVEDFPIIEKINIPKGFNGLEITKNEFGVEEGEVLLPRDTKFKVLKSWKEGRFKWIEVEPVSSQKLNSLLGDVADFMKLNYRCEFNGNDYKCGLDSNSSNTNKAKIQTTTQTNFLGMSAIEKERGERLDLPAYMKPVWLKALGERTLPKDDPNYFYHATTGDRLDSIIQYGLVPGKSKPNFPAEINRHTDETFLSKRLNDVPGEPYGAEYWSQMIYRQNNKKTPIILRVKQSNIQNAAKIGDEYEYRTKEGIPSNTLEILRNGKWESLTKQNHNASYLQEAATYLISLNRQGKCPRGTVDDSFKCGEEEPGKEKEPEFIGYKTDHDFSGKNTEIDPKIQTSLDRAASPLKTIGSEELQALKGYTGVAYKTINDYLSRGLKDAPDYIIEETKQNIDKLDKIFSHAELTEPLIAYRGIKDSIIVDNPELREALDTPGSEVQFPCFTSSSAMPYVANNFAEGYNGRLIKLQLPIGTKAIYISGNGPFGLVNEFEILINRNTKFEVIETKYTEIKGPKNFSTGPKRTKVTTLKAIL